MNGDGLRQRIATMLQPYAESIVKAYDITVQHGQVPRMPLPDDVPLVSAIERLIRAEQRALLLRCLQTDAFPGFPATSSREKATEIAINVQNELKALEQLEEPQA